MSKVRCYFVILYSTSPERQRAAPIISHFWYLLFSMRFYIYICCFFKFEFPIKREILAKRSPNFYCASAEMIIFTVRLHIMQRTVLLSQFCPSVRREYCDKTKWWTADILLPQETAITLVFSHQHWLVGDSPFPVKYSPKVTHPLRKTPTLTHCRS